MRTWWRIRCAPIGGRSARCARPIRPSCSCASSVASVEELQIEEGRLVNRLRDQLYRVNAAVAHPLSRGG